MTDGEKTSPEYDVAISFLVKDEAIARELHQNLSPYLKVFFFPHDQEELAGTDGLESMRTPFLSARLTVVLFSGGWGETPWTRVEATAIKDSCLERGWDHLFFVDLSKAAKLPVWLPKTHVRLNYSVYGAKQAVGAIKARVEELGGELVRPNAQSIARNAKLEVEYEANRRSKFRDQSWIINEVHPSAGRIINIVAQKVDAIKAEEGLEIAHAVVSDNNSRTPHYVANYNLRGLTINWVQRFINILEESHLEVTVWNEEMPLPGYYRPYGQPPALKTLNYLPDVGRDGKIVWKHRSRTELLDEETLAEEILENYFNTVIGRINMEQDAW